MKTVRIAEIKKIQMDHVWVADGKMQNGSLTLQCSLAVSYKIKYASFATIYSELGD
jgi:hypothetical protein